jgi:hypothetical protein
MHRGTKATELTGFIPTHRAPTSGLLGWSAPESNRSVTLRISPGAALEVIERRANWAFVRDADGATAWVEFAGLQSLMPARSRNPWVALLIVIVLLALLAGGAYLYIRARVIQGEPSNNFGSGFTRVPTVLYTPGISAISGSTQLSPSVER